MKRSRRAELARETLEILERGWYLFGNRKVELNDVLERAQRETIDVPYWKSLPSPTSKIGRTTVISVTDETTLSASLRLARTRKRPVALSFASAKNPGGGFLKGAEAQEESLARSSGLFACLEGQPMYDLHRPQRDPLYTNYAIYSPEVPVFRNEDGELLEEPVLVSFITSPAPNAGAVLGRDPSRRREVSRALEERIDRVLTLGASQGHDVIVLGAWGCGVFRNDPEEVATLFSEALDGRFAGVFSEAVFAVPRFSKRDSVQDAFLSILGEEVQL